MSCLEYLRLVKIPKNKSIKEKIAEIIKDEDPNFQKEQREIRKDTLTIRQYLRTIKDKQKNCPIYVKRSMITVSTRINSNFKDFEIYQQI
jgi:hypothetical protein